MIRLRCVVVNCRHTRGPHKGEREFTGDEQWVCGDHWRLTSRADRQLMFKARRRGKPWLAAFMWKKLVAQAMERGAGI